MFAVSVALMDVDTVDAKSSIYTRASTRRRPQPRAARGSAPAPSEDANLALAGFSMKATVGFDDVMLIEERR